MSEPRRLTPRALVYLRALEAAAEADAGPAAEHVAAGGESLFPPDRPEDPS